jgi:hypothetical protein
LFALNLKLKQHLTFGTVLNALQMLPQPKVHQALRHWSPDAQSLPFVVLMLKAKPAHLCVQPSLKQESSALLLGSDLNALQMVAHPKVRQALLHGPLLSFEVVVPDQQPLHSEQTSSASLL